MRWDSFREFMNNVFVKLKDTENWEQTRRELFDGHLEKQMSFFGIMNITDNGWSAEELNSLKKYENLQEEFDLICKVDLNIEPITLKRWNNSNHLGYSHYYDGHTINLVRENYKEDIETFRYNYA
tara:strand:+ start:44 stop:418 length:375 start_codon:yes stop_codon:yes gene_type:complete